MVAAEGMAVDEGGTFGSAGVDNMMWPEEVGLKRCSSRRHLLYLCRGFEASVSRCLTAICVLKGSVSFGGFERLRQFEPAWRPACCLLA